MNAAIAAQAEQQASLSAGFFLDRNYFPKW
jgi:hypothetical protein